MPRRWSAGARLPSCGPAFEKAGVREAEPRCPPHRASGPRRPWRGISAAGSRCFPSALGPVCGEPHAKVPERIFELPQLGRKVLERIFELRELHAKVPEQIFEPRELHAKVPEWIFELRVL